MKNIMGLTSEEVTLSRQKYGGNALEGKSKNGFFKQFLLSFDDPIIKVLLVALFINSIAAIKGDGLIEMLGVAAAIIVSTLVSAVSERGSEAAFEKMRESTANIKCRVIRNGEIKTVSADEIVVNDAVLLGVGEGVPADGYIIDGNISVNQSALNGESKEAKKSVGEMGGLTSKGGVFRGSTVMTGQGVMKVTKVGKNTMLGSMAAEIQADTRESPLKLRLSKLAKILSGFGYIAAALVAVSDLFNTFVIANNFDINLIKAAVCNTPVLIENLVHALILAISVVVVAVPEGLPMMITVVLSSNMMRMIKDNVLVRKPVGIETSGSMNILFTDKTGTLTNGKLTVTEIITGDGKKLDGCIDNGKIGEILMLSGYYNTAAVKSSGISTGGNATDRALLNALPPKPKWAMGYEVKNAIPFDSDKKYSSVTIKKDIQNITLYKGAPEIILEKCGYFVLENGNKKLLNHTLIKKKLHEMTSNALRVIAVCFTEEATDKLTLAALVGIRDDLRKNASKAVKLINKAGIQTVMITGDNLDTASAIAREAGILKDDGVVLDGKELRRMTDEKIEKLLPKLRVIARAVPTDKSRLVEIAQKSGMVVGMTGDGVNDAPALKKADVGFSLGSGTEVAKEAGDIVILDDDISSIGKAVLYGRTIFKSIRKFIVFQLTMNLCAVGISVLGPILGFDTPITVIQMLWINLIMDTLAGLAFAGEAPLPEYMEEKPKRREEAVMTKDMMKQTVFMGTVTLIMSALFLKHPYFDLIYPNAAYKMTAFFGFFVFCGVFNAFNTRTPRIKLFAHLGKNMTFCITMLTVMLTQIMLMYLGGDMFRTCHLTLTQLFYSIIPALIVVPTDVLRKILCKKKKISAFSTKTTISNEKSKNNSLSL